MKLPFLTKFGQLYLYNGMSAFGAVRFWSGLVWGWSGFRAVGFWSGRVFKRSGYSVVGFWSGPVWERSGFGAVWFLSTWVSELYVYIQLHTYLAGRPQCQKPACQLLCFRVVKFWNGQVLQRSALERSEKDVCRYF